MSGMIDPQSATWREIRSHINNRIALLQRHLESPSDADDTAMLRGQIKEARALIAEFEPTPRAPLPEYKIVKPIY